MPLQPGTKLGPYEVVSPVGAGGMGEVYQAKDLRLERVVAIKVLPTHLSANVDLRLRFEREAKVISGLQHPHICVLFDVGEHEGIAFLVMEFLEGETLASRIQRKPLSTDDALRIGIEIADALDKAHKQGVVHRDLKPGNVMLTKEGAKLMDFGLAKPAAFATAAGSAAPSFTAVNTMSHPHSPITMAGSVVGTVQYMSPEQVQGQEVDGRSDIFSFGAMLYEMVTGKRAFEGKSQLSVASAILEKEPEPISAVQPLSPPALEHVVRACLTKDPADRWQNIADVKRELIWIQEGGSKLGLPAVVKHHRKWQERGFWIAGLVLALSVAPAVFWLTRPLPTPQIKSSITLPDGMQMGRPGSFAISPDGKKLAYLAQAKNSKIMMYVRSLDSLDAQPLANTEEAWYPFWSPDGQNIGFFAGGKLKKVDAAGGAVQTLCDANDARGGTWNKDGVIIFSPNFDGGLFKVSAAGGTPVEVMKPPEPSGYTLRWPQFLPDGDHFLFFQTTSGATTTGPGTGTYFASLSGGSKELIIPEFSVARYAEGRLLFVRDGNLLAQLFDAAKGKLSGEPVPIVEKIEFEQPRAIAALTVSENGLLMYRSADSSGAFQWTWFDESGSAGEKVGQASTFTFATESHDRKRLLFVDLDAKGDRSLWMYDVVRGVATRFSFGERSASQWGGNWSPDDRLIAYASNRTNMARWDIYLRDTSGSQPDRLLYQGPTWSIPLEFTPDGKYLSFVTDSKETKWDIWLLPLQGEAKPKLLKQTKGHDIGANFSPDGRWFSYQSNESGRHESYLASMANPEAHWQISANGGNIGWFCKSDQFMYEDLDQKVVAVEMDLSGPEPKIGKSRPAFPGVDVGAMGNYSVSRDCKQLLAGVPLRTTTPRMTLVTNWTAKLKK
ncbi:MAG TPA: protein kinase [Terriglobales bacterium]|nr:protein kinase [Terriglobales bacterium]